MPDYRVQDYRAEDGRLREVGLVAAGLFHQAGSASMRDGTDGWVPEHYVRSWRGGPGAARKLVEVGLWTRHRLGSRDGYLFDQEEWAREQRLAVEVEEDREKARQRARRHRQSQKDQRLAASGQLTTGPVPVPLPPEPDDDEDTVTRDVTRDATRTSRENVTPGVTAHVTPARHAERALLPHPHPLPRGGSVEEESSGSERASAATAPSPSPFPAPGTISDLAGLTRAELDDLDPRCDLHRAAPPGTPTPSCRDCLIRRRAITAARDRAATAETTARGLAHDTRRALVDDCGSCDEHGWLLGPDRAPVDPATRCAHQPPAATGTGGEHP